MIEETVLDYLNNAMAGIPVYMQTPPEPPEEYVTLAKTGSGKSDGIMRAAFVFRSHAATLYRAAQINELVKTAMDDITILDDIVRSELNSDYNYTDTRTKIPRYQAVYDLVHY